MGKLMPFVSGVIKMSFCVQKRSARIFGKAKTANCINLGNKISIPKSLYSLKVRLTYPNIFFLPFTNNPLTCTKSAVIT